MGCSSSKSVKEVNEPKADNIKENTPKEQNPVEKKNLVVKESLNDVKREQSMSPSGVNTNLTSHMDKKTRTNDSIKIEVYPRQDVRKTNIRRLSHFAYYILCYFIIFRNIQEEDEEKICEKSQDVEELISQAIQKSSVFL